MTTWADVEVGDVVEGKRSVAWTVTALSNRPKLGERKVSLQAGVRTHEMTVLRIEAVKILERGAPTISGVDPSELAAAVVTSTIGGEVILEARAGDPFPQAPRRFAQPGALLAHLYVMHGIHEGLERAGAEEFHEQHHANAAGAPGYHDHDHVL